MRHYSGSTTTPEEAAQFYLSVFPHDSSTSCGPKASLPWPVGKIATIVRCDSQEEIDSYWDKLIESGKPMACVWLTERFGRCWHIVPRYIGELIRHARRLEAGLWCCVATLPFSVGPTRIESSFDA